MGALQRKETLDVIWENMHGERVVASKSTAASKVIQISFKKYFSPRIEIHNIKGFIDTMRKHIHQHL